MSYQPPGMPGWTPGQPQPIATQHVSQRPPPAIVKVLWGATAAGALLGLVMLVVSFVSGPSLFGATQLANAVTAIALVAVPYAAARAAEELSR